MRLTLLAILFLLVNCVFAEKANTDPSIDPNLKDSLEQIIKNSNSVNEKNEAYVSLAENYLKINDSLANHYCKKVFQSNPPASNFLLGRAYYIDAMVDVYNNEDTESITKLEKSISHFNQIKEKPFNELGQAYLNLGRAKRLTGKYYEAIKLLSTALEYFEEDGDLKGIANCTNHIGIIYDSINDDEKAKEYYKRCQELYEEIDYQIGQVYIFNNLGYIEEKAGNYEKALNLYKKGLELSRSTELITMEVHLMSNLAQLYIKIEKYDECEKAITDGMLLAQENDNIRLYNFFKLTKAQLFLRRDKSLRYYDEVVDVLNFAEEKQFRFLGSVAEKVLKEMYLHMGDFEKAYMLSEKMKAEKDSTDSKKIAKEFEFQDSKFKDEVRLNTQKLYSQKNEFAKKLIYAISLFSLMMILMFSFFVRKLKGSNNRLKEKNKELEKKDLALNLTGQELEERNQKLKLYIESNTQLEKFARATSHDIKTPLRTIASFAGLLEKSSQSKLDAKENEYLSHIIEGAKRLGNITNDLLNSSVDGDSLNIKKINMQDLIDNNLDDLAFIIQQTNTKFHIGEMPEDIFADETKLRRVVQNLIENAIKYSSQDKTPVICINCQEKEFVYQFSISDNGIGIDSKDYERVFKTFGRIDNQGHDKGVGLGLSICKNNIEKHGGDLWINPEYEGGTEFCFTIPKIAN